MHMFWCSWSVHLNFYVTNKSFFVLSGSIMPREMEYDYLAIVGDFLALSQSFFLYLQVIVNVFSLFVVSVCVLPACKGCP